MVALVSAHEVERVTADAGSRDELAERDRMSLGAVRDRQQETLVTGVEYAPERHREASFDLATTPLHHDGPDRVRQRRLNPGRVVERDRVAVVRDPVDGLAQAFAGPALQREGPHVHDALVADVPLVHTGAPVDAEPLLAGAEHGHRPAAFVREAAERRPELVALLGLTDRVGRDQADSPVDGVRDQAVAIQEGLLVAAKCEVVERAGAETPDYVGGAPGGVGATTRAVPVYDGPERQHERDGRQPETDGEQGRVQEGVHPRIEGHGPDTHEAPGRGPPGFVPGDRTAATMGRDHAPENSCADQGDRDDATEERGEACPERGQVETRPEGSPRPPQRGHEHEGCDGLDDLAVADQMKRHRPGEQPDRDEPSQALASSHAAGDRQEPDAGERDESSCCLAHSEGDVAEQGMQPPPDLRWHDGGDEVGEPEDRDPG